MDEQQLLTVSELCKWLRLSPTTVYRMVEEGDLPAMRWRRGYRFDKEAIEKWLEEKTVTEEKDAAS